MKPKKYDPISEIEKLHQKINLIFGDILSYHPNWGNMTSEGWNPPVDIMETESEFRVDVELPGMDREDIQIHQHPAS